MSVPSGPRVSVVVPVRDDARIDALLESLAAQEGPPPFEVVVALDGSRRTPVVPPGLPARLLTLTPRGPYSARNAAARDAKGEVVLLTDSDCLCPGDWIARAAREFRSASLRVLQGGSRSASQTRLSRWIQLEYEEYVASHSGTGFRRFCNTRSLGIRRELLLEMPFRETFPRGGDGAYGLELERAGIAIRYEPDWFVRHAHPRSRWAEGVAAFEQGRQGGRWKAAGFDLFGGVPGTPARGPGALLGRAIPEGRAARLAGAAALLGVAALLGAGSAVLLGESGYPLFSRGRRAAHLAGRWIGEAQG